MYFVMHILVASFEKKLEYVLGVGFKLQLGKTEHLPKYRLQVL